MIAREPEPGDRVGPYLLERKLGEGGMGLVFEGVDTRGENRRVAVKVLKPEAADERLELARFDREARLASQLTSPSSVRVLDAGLAANGLPYIVMELVPARDLAAELRHGRVPAQGEMLIWARQVLEALAEAHRLGIVHRDVKPSNILIERKNGVARAKLADFGISKDLGAERLTETGMFVGTPRYMAPEQIMNPRAIDGRVDLWALGVVLYEYFAGESPFIGATAVDIVANVLSTDPLPLDRIAPALGRTIMQTLEKDPSLRPRTAEELSERLAPFAVAAEVVDPLAPTVTVDGLVSSKGRGTPSSGGSKGSQGSKGSRSRRKKRSNKVLFAVASICGAGLAAGAIAIVIPLLTPESQLAPTTSVTAARPAASLPPRVDAAAPDPTVESETPSLSASSPTPPRPAPIPSSGPPLATARVTGTRGITSIAASAWTQANRGALDTCFNISTCDFTYNMSLLSKAGASVGSGHCAPPTSFYECFARLLDAHPLKPSCNEGESECSIAFSIPTKR